VPFQICSIVDFRGRVRDRGFLIGQLESKTRAWLALIIASFQIMVERRLSKEFLSLAHSNLILSRLMYSSFKMIPSFRGHLASYLKVVVSRFLNRD